MISAFYAPQGRFPPHQEYLGCSTHARQMAVGGPPTEQSQPSLGCSIHEFVESGSPIPPLAAYVEELAGFGAACRAAAEAATKSSRRKGGAPTALRRQAARDADMLLLAEWCLRNLAQTKTQTRAVRPLQVVELGCGVAPAAGERL